MGSWVKKDDHTHVYTGLCSYGTAYLYEFLGHNWHQKSEFCQQLVVWLWTIALTSMGLNFFSLKNWIRCHQRFLPFLKVYFMTFQYCNNSKDQMQTLKEVPKQWLKHVLRNKNHVDEPHKVSLKGTTLIWMFKAHLFKRKGKPIKSVFIILGYKRQRIRKRERKMRAST